MRVSLLLLLSVPMVDAKPSLKGALQIIVPDAVDGPVYLATVTVKNRLLSRTIRVDQTITLEQIPPGSYLIEVRAPNYAPQDGSVVIKAGETERFALTPTPTKLSMRVQVVAPSSFSLIQQNRQVSSQYLDRDTVRRLPRFGDDFFRALNTVPGTSSNDFGSAFTVRGGEYREVRVLLDGMELYEPFHLKDFAGIFSFIAPETIGGVSINTGGFDAGYGNALSGVMALSSSEPSEFRSHAQISLGGLSYQNEGRFNHGLGQYVFSARRGYFDLLLSIIRARRLVSHPALIRHHLAFLTTTAPKCPPPFQPRIGDSHPLTSGSNKNVRLPIPPGDAAFLFYGRQAGARATVFPSIDKPPKQRGAARSGTPQTSCLATRAGCRIRR